MPENQPPSSEPPSSETPPARPPTAQAQPVTLFQILLCDFRINQLVGMSVLLTLMGLFLALFSQYIDVGVAALLLGLLAALILLARVTHFQRLREEGTPTRGTITRIQRSWFGRRGRFRYRVAYTYTYQEQSYRGIALVSLFPHALTVQEQDEVTVLVRPARPRQSLVPVLFAA